MLPEHGCGGTFHLSLGMLGLVNSSEVFCIIGEVGLNILEKKKCFLIIVPSCVFILLIEN